jgi:hypothetical protein
MSQGTTPNVFPRKAFRACGEDFINPSFRVLGCPRCELKSATPRSLQVHVKDFSASRPLSASPLFVPHYRCCGVGGGNGFRGNISVRFAVMYTNDATMTAICFMSGS